MRCVRGLIAAGYLGLMPRVCIRRASARSCSQKAASKFVSGVTAPDVVDQDVEVPVLFVADAGDEPGDRGRVGVVHRNRDAAPRGETQWVRNLRASGTGRLRLGRCTWAFTAVELPPADSVDPLRPYLQRWRWEVGKFFGGVGCRRN